MTSNQHHVAVIDVGKLSNLGWVIEGPLVNESGNDIDRCIEVLAQSMRSGPLALGFEAPLFVPYDRDRCDLDKARRGERDRAFSASAGACVLAKSLVIIPYILSGLRQRVEDAKPTFQWRRPMGRRDLLLFEAFVTHMPSGAAHTECARMALREFGAARGGPTSLRSAIDEPVVLNLLGAILLRLKWTDDPNVLSEPCLVVRYQGK
jgi:hypothetical protein